MNENVSNENVKLAAANLENALLDGAIKRLEVEQRQSELSKTWTRKRGFTNPAVVAGLITIFVSFGTAFITFVIAKEQQALELSKTNQLLTLEREKHQQQLALDRDKYQRQLILDRERYEQQLRLDRQRHEDGVLSATLADADLAQKGCVVANRLSMYLDAQVFTPPRLAAVQKIRDHLRQNNACR